jgi:hypothetical protein
MTASLVAACALAQAGAVGLDILRHTFDGIASKNYGDAYRDDADKLFHTMSKPVEDGISTDHAAAAPASTQQSPASASISQPATAPSSMSGTYAPVESARNQAAIPASESAPALALEVSVLKEEIVGGRSMPVPIQDGDVLYDRFGSHGVGDNIKFMFRANAAAYVYLISIDGTGWIQPIFPGAYAGFSNPVEPDRTYLFPEGSTWAPLDSYRGVEHLYFIASRTQRPDLEKSLAAFASRIRDEDPSRGAQRPTELAQVTSEAPLTRGFEAPRKSAVPDVPSSTGEPFQVDAQTFTNPGRGDIVVTRWFRHQ